MFIRFFFANPTALLHGFFI